jgi:hypothetical protein
VNTTGDPHHTTEESLAAYALGALDESERVAVEAHLEDCAGCRARAAALEEAANRLPLALSAASPLAPPASLEDRLMRRIVGEREPRPARPRAVRWLRPRLALPVAAALVVAAFGAWNLHLSSALSEERSLRERLEQLIGHQETVLDVVDSERTVRRVLLPSRPAPSGPYGKLFTRTDQPEVVAMIARLPRPPQGRTYQLWLRRGGRERRAGTLDVNAQGFGLIVFRGPGPGPDYEEARVTLQPPGAARPGAPVLAWHATS